MRRMSQEGPSLGDPRVVLLVCKNPVFRLSGQRGSPKFCSLLNIDRASRMIEPSDVTLRAAASANSEGVAEAGETGPPHFVAIAIT